MANHRLTSTMMNRILSCTTSITSLALIGFGQFNLMTFVNMPHLTDLLMPYCSLGDESCHDLAQCSPQLHALGLRGNNNITIRGLHKLSLSLKKLRRLDLKMTAIQVPEITRLLRDEQLFPRLTHLLLPVCSRESQADRNKLLRIRKKLIITHKPPSPLKCVESLPSAGITVTL